MNIVTNPDCSYCSVQFRDCHAELLQFLNSRGGLPSKQLPIALALPAASYRSNGEPNTMCLLLDEWRALYISQEVVKHPTIVTSGPTPRFSAGQEASFFLTHSNF